MKNKNKHLGYNDFEKNKDLALFESKFVYLAEGNDERLEGDTWEEDTTLEKGISESRSILNEFDETYNPLDERHRVNSVEDTVAGVRDRMNQGVFNNLNVLSGGAILHRRVLNRYLNVVASAPTEVREIIDEEVRRRGGVPIENWSVAERKTMEREVAADLFTHEMQAGATYDTLTTDIETEMGALGLIAPTIRDAAGQQIDLAIPNSTNEYIVQGGQRPVLAPDIPNGTRRLPGEERVVIHWYTEDFAIIKNKCEKAGIWARLQDEANEFLQLKMRHSFAKRILMEEKAKLSVDRFSPERLERWMANDWTRQAFQEDAQYQEWLETVLTPACQRIVGPPAYPPIRTIDELQRLRPDMWRELKRQQEAARERIGQNAIKNHLERILLPHELENLSKSEVTRTLLAYLYHKFQDNLDGPDVRRFIKKLSGQVTVDENVEENMQTLDTATENITNFLDNYEDQDSQVQGMRAQIITINTRITAIDGITVDAYRYLNERKTLDDKRRELQEQLRVAQTKLIKQIQALRKFIEDNRSSEGVFRTDLPTLAGPLWTSTLLPLLTNATLRTRPTTPAQRNSFVTRFRIDIYRNTDFHDAMEFLQNQIKTAKTRTEQLAEKQKDVEEKGPEKMDSRSLLFELVQRDLREKGVTDASRLQRLSVITTNMLVLKIDNSNNYKNVNQALASDIELQQQPRWRRFLRSAIGVFDTTPTSMSGEDVLKFVISTEPDLAIFKNMNLASSRADMINMMNMHGRPSNDSLKRFQKKLSEFIRGLEIPNTKGIIGKSSDWFNETFFRGYKKLPTKMRLILQANDTTYVENTIHILQQIESELAAERIVNNVREEVRENGDANAADAFHEHLYTQTETNVATTKRLAKELEPAGARFKKLTIRSFVQEELDEANAEGKYLSPEDRDDLLKEKGIRGFAVDRFPVTVKAWTKLKNGLETVFSSPYSPLTWPVFIPFQIGKSLKKFLAPNWKEFKDEWDADLEKAKPFHKGLFWRPLVKQPVALVGGLAIWALRWPQRILGGVVGDTAVNKNKMRTT